MTKVEILLDKYRSTVATDSKKARYFIRQLDYKENFYFLNYIAQTYLDEAIFEEAGKDKMRKEMNFRKWRMAEKYIIEALKLIRIMQKFFILWEELENRISMQEYSRGKDFAKELINDAKFELYRLYRYFSLVLHQ